LLSSVKYIRTPHMTYRTQYQAAASGNTGSPHNSRSPMQQISIRWNKELRMNRTQKDTIGSKYGKK